MRKSTRNSLHPQHNLRDSIWGGNQRQPNRKSVNPNNPRTTVCIAGMASKKHNLGEKNEQFINRRTKLGKKLSLRLAMNDNRMKQTDHLLCELSGINLPEGVSFSNFTDDVQNKINNQSNRLILLEKLYSSYFSTFNELKKQLQTCRMELIHINNPDGHRVAPVDKSTSIELNQSYSINQVLQQRSECLEIIFELRKNIAKNHDYAKSCENKITHMDEILESKFAKQKLTENEQFFKNEEVWIKNVKRLEEDVGKFKRAFDAVAMECYKKEEQFDDEVERLRNEFNIEKSKVKSLEKFSKELAGKLGSVNDSKGKTNKKYQKCKFENYNLKQQILDLIEENKQFRIKCNQDQIIKKQHPNTSKYKRKLDSTPLNTEVPDNVKTVQQNSSFFIISRQSKENNFLKPVKSSKSLKNLVVSSPRENITSNNKINNATDTTTTNSTSLTVLMPTQSSDIGKAIEGKLKLPTRYNKFFRLPKLTNENTIRENCLAKPAAPKILEIDVNRNFLENLKNCKM